MPTTVFIDIYQFIEEKFKWHPKDSIDIQSFIWVQGSEEYESKHTYAPLLSSKGANIFSHKKTVPF